MLGARFGRKFTNRIPDEHFEKMEDVHEAYMRKKPGIIKKVLMIVTTPIILSFILMPGKTFEFFRNYEKTFGLLKSYIAPYLP